MVRPCRSRSAIAFSSNSCDEGWRPALGCTTTTSLGASTRRGRARESNASFGRTLLATDALFPLPLPLHQHHHPIPIPHPLQPQGRTRNSSNRSRWPEGGRGPHGRPPKRSRVGPFFVWPPLPARGTLLGSHPGIPYQSAWLSGFVLDLLPCHPQSGITTRECFLPKKFLLRLKFPFCT